MFIELTMTTSLNDTNPTLATFNVSHIVEVHTQEQGTIIETVDGTYCVKESYEEVKAMLLPVFN